jgi:AraC family transcriptional regulator
MDQAIADRQERANAVSRRRLQCRGFDVAWQSTPAGVVKVPPTTNHYVTIHAGAPVRFNCRCDGGQYRRVYTRGDTEILPAGADGVWVDEDPATLLRLTMTPGFLRNTAEGLALDPDRLALTPRFALRDPRIEHVAWALEAEFMSGRPEERLYVESLGTALAVHVLRHYGVTALSLRQALSSWQRRRVLDYIEAHLDASLGLAELAEVAGLGTSHFKALFKHSLGAPVHQYVVRRRVERARDLLLAGDRPIAEVALEAGFAHQSHMAQWMQRLLGVTPSELRRERAAAE